MAADAVNHKVISCSVARIVSISITAHSLPYTMNCKLRCKLTNLSLKRITVTYNNSLGILPNLSSRCASFTFATDYIKSFNERIHSSKYVAFYVVFISLKTVFVNYFHTDIHFGSSMYKYWTSQLYTWYLFWTLFLIFFSVIFFHDLFIFITYLFVPHNCFNCILCIVLSNLFYVYIWTFFK